MQMKAADIVLKKYAFEDFVWFQTRLKFVQNTIKTHLC